MINKTKTIGLTIFALFMAIVGGLIVCREAAILISGFAKLVIDSILPLARAIIGILGIGTAGYLIDRYDLCSLIAPLNRRSSS